MGLFYILHVVICILLVVTILFQDGKTGGLTGIADNASQQMFGAKGAANFLTKLTTGLAIFFMISSLFLAIMSTPSGKSIADDYQPEKTEESSVAAPDEAEGEAPETSQPSGGVRVIDDEGNEQIIPLSEAIDSIEVVPAEEAPDHVLEAHEQDMRRQQLERQKQASEREQNPPAPKEE